MARQWRARRIGQGASAPATSPSFGNTAAAPRSSAWRGVVSGRLESARMKSTISITSGEPE